MKKTRCFCTTFTDGRTPEISEKIDTKSLKITLVKHDWHLIFRIKKSNVIKDHG